MFWKFVPTEKNDQVWKSCIVLICQTNDKPHFKYKISYFQYLQIIGLIF